MCVYNSIYMLGALANGGEGEDYLRIHTGQHSPSTNEGLAQATGGQVIW